MNSLSVVIMAGGSGKRLWPISRASYPKQFLNLTNDKSMLQETLIRLSDLKIKNIFVICNENHRFIVADQIHQLKKTNSKIVLEPVSRNTAPAITAVSMMCNNESSILVLPSDHFIENNERFIELINDAKKHVEDNKIVTFGVKPNHPNINYGYIETGNSYLNGFKIKSFKEKPAINVAEKYLSDGNYYWNSGIFFFKKEVFLEELLKNRPNMYKSCQESVQNMKIDSDFIRFPEKTFSKCEDESVDYAVMENTNKASMIPMDVGWNDVGSWSSLFTILPKDSNGNYVDGDSYLSDTKNSLIKTDGVFITTSGIEDTLVVATKDAIMISNLNKQNDIRDIVESIAKQGKIQASENREVVRPWGKYDSIEVGKSFQVKKITVNPGAKLSLQMHHKRSEHWVVVSGTAIVTRANETITLNENESVYIPLETIHTVENPTKEPLEFIEVQYGSYLGEDDIIRFEDIYGRVKD